MKFELKLEYRINQFLRYMTRIMWNSLQLQMQDTETSFKVSNMTFSSKCLQSSFVQPNSQSKKRLVRNFGNGNQWKNSFRFGRSFLTSKISPNDVHSKWNNCSIKIYWITIRITTMWLLNIKKIMSIKQANIEWRRLKFAGPTQFKILWDHWLYFKNL